MKTKTITERGLRNVATRAVNSFTPANGNGACVSINEDGTVYVRTIAAGGDNVPWARKLMDRVTSRLCITYPLSVDWSTIQHSCGNCIITLRRSA